MAKKVEIQLGLNSRGFAAGLASATTSLGQFAKSLGSSMFGQFLGAQGVITLFQKLIGEFDKFITRAETIKNSAELFGGDTQFTQRLIQDAEDAQVPFEKLKSVFVSISEAREKALYGKDSLEWIGQFAKFGISLDMIREKSPVELFNAVRDAISSMSAEAASAADTLTAMASLGIKGRQISIMRTPDVPGERMGIMNEREMQQAEVAHKTEKAITRFWTDTMNVMLTAITKTIGGELGIEDQELTPRQKAFVQKRAERSRDGMNEEAARQWLLADEAARDADFAKGLEEHPYKAPKATKAPHQFAYDIPTDPMARMGAFIGGAANLGSPQLNIGRQQLDVERKMESHLRKIAAYWDTQLRTVPNPFWE